MPVAGDRLAPGQIYLHYLHAELLLPQEASMMVKKIGEIDVVHGRDVVRQ